MERSRAFWDGVKYYGVRMVRIDSGRTGLLRAEIERDQTRADAFDGVLYRTALNCILKLGIFQSTLIL